MSDTEISCLRSVRAALPLSARSRDNTNSPSFHVLRLPAIPANPTRLRRIFVEWAIQPLGVLPQQAIWWTAYIFVVPPGTLDKATGVYTEWNQFATLSSQSAVGIVNLRPENIYTTDVHKGVINGRQTNHAMVRVADLNETPSDFVVYSCLVASATYDGAYQVHGHARLEYVV